MTTWGALLLKGPNLGSCSVLPISGHAVPPPPLLSEALQLQHAPGAAVGLGIGVFRNRQQQEGKHTPALPSQRWSTWPLGNGLETPEGPNHLLHKLCQTDEIMNSRQKNPAGPHSWPDQGRGEEPHLNFPRTSPPCSHVFAAGLLPATGSSGSRRRSAPALSEAETHRRVEWRGGYTESQGHGSEGCNPRGQMQVDTPAAQIEPVPRQNQTCPG